MRQMLADLDAGRARGDRLELAADPVRGVGLQVEAVVLRQPAGEEDVDHGLGPRCLACRPDRSGAAKARKPSTWFIPKFNSPIAPAWMPCGGKLGVLRGRKRIHGSTGGLPQAMVCVQAVKPLQVSRLGASVQEMTEQAIGSI